VYQIDPRLTVLSDAVIQAQAMDSDFWSNYQIKVNPKFHDEHYRQMDRNQHKDTRQSAGCYEEVKCSFKQPIGSLFDPSIAPRAVCYDSHCQPLDLELRTSHHPAA